MCSRHAKEDAKSCKSAPKVKKGETESRKKGPASKKKTSSMCDTADDDKDIPIGEVGYKFRKQFFDDQNQFFEDPNQFFPEPIQKRILDHENVHARGASKNGVPIVLVRNPIEKKWMTVFGSRL